MFINTYALPAVFASYLDENRIIHNYNTRQKDNFHTYSVHSETGKRSIKYKGSKLWNRLPPELKNITTNRCFKVKLKNYILQTEV